MDEVSGPVRPGRQSWGVVSQSTNRYTGTHTTLIHTHITHTYTHTIHIHTTHIHIHTHYTHTTHIHTCTHTTHIQGGEERGRIGMQFTGGVLVQQAQNSEFEPHTIQTSVVGTPVILVLKGWRQVDPEFKIMVENLASLRPAWDM